MRAGGDQRPTARLREVPAWLSIRYLRRCAVRCNPAEAPRPRLFHIWNVPPERGPTGPGWCVRVARSPSGVDNLAQRRSRPRRELVNKRSRTPLRTALIMANLNVFIDGTWLFYQCGGGQCLPNATASPNSRFRLDFTKLNDALLAHVRGAGGQVDGVNELYVATSIFSLPDDFDDWPNQYDDVTPDHIDRTRRGVHAREEFVSWATEAGYRTDAVFRPPIRNYIIRRLSESRYQEKQVDTAVVALLVRAAIVREGDFHVLITGDSDTLPALRVAYPQYTENVLVATTHPDELRAAHRQTAFSLVDFDFRIPPFYLQDNAHLIIQGDHVYRCGECGKVFALSNPLPRAARPYCPAHRQARARR